MVKLPPWCKTECETLVGREGAGAGVLEVSYILAALPSDLDCSFYWGSSYVKIHFNEQVFFFFKYDFFKE